jgi:hypothetical protein
MQERRHTERFRVNLHARWESLLAEGRGDICDLSASGCFMLGAGQINTGELVRVEIQFPNHLVLVWGQVVYSVVEMGFAVRFVFGEENESRALRKLIEKLHQQPV